MKQNNFFRSPLESPVMVTLPKLSKLKSGAQKLSLSIPKEIYFQENRVALTPESVSRLCSLGHSIKVESGAGTASYFSDNDFSEAGAEIVHTKEQLYDSHIILRIAPTPIEDFQYLRLGQIIFSAIHLPKLSKEYLDQILKKKCICVAYEYLKDSEGTLPIVRAMSEIAGISAILIAGECLSRANHGSGKLLGGVAGLAPSKVLILGAGTVGEFAARAAMGLGATVRVFDKSLSKLRRLQNNIGARVFTSVLQSDVLLHELKTSDVVIGAIHSNDGRSPMVVSEEMVMTMQPGSVIIDVSIDQGGCFETSEITTHDSPIIRVHDVVHYCVPNIPSRVSKTASLMMGNILTTLLIDAADFGGFENFLWVEKGLRNGIYAFNGSITNKYISQKFDLPYANLELLARTRF